MRIPFAGAKTTKSVDLDKIELAFPCPMKWEDMVGDERERFCQSCALNVYNLSSMSKKEAEEFLLLRSESRICLNFKRRKDGTIITDNCPRALRAVRDKTRRAVAVCANAFLFCLTTVCTAAGAQLPPVNWGKKITAPSDNGGYPGDANRRDMPRNINVTKPTDTTGECASKAEEAYLNRIDWFAKHKKTNTVDGARNYLDLAGWYRSKSRLSESKNSYDKAIDILKLIPAASKTYENAILNRQSLQNQLDQSQKSENSSGSASTSGK
jgi:hypothetical protein